MAFPLRSGMTRAEFKAEVIDYYFPHLDDPGKMDALKLTAPARKVPSSDDAKKLRHDYAEIGAFLTRKADVEDALVGLENSIRDYVVIHKPPNADKIKTFRADGMKRFKLDKILTNVLARYELSGGFNNPEVIEAVIHSTHSTALTAKGKGDAPFTFSEHGRKLADKLSLPQKTVPKVFGTDLDGKDFNQILLRHGYQFKDVGAGERHGEFTHRLQWYAVMRAVELGLIKLNNPAIEIFKSMALLSAQGSANIEVGKHLYIWESLFDCAINQAGANVFKTLALSPDTYNCPEVLNISLAKLPPGVEYNEQNAANLYSLRVILTVRFKKRAAERELITNGSQSETAMLSKHPTRDKLVVSAAPTAVPHSDGGLVKAGIMWYLD